MVRTIGALRESWHTGSSRDLIPPRHIAQTRCGSCKSLALCQATNPIRFYRDCPTLSNLLLILVIIAWNIYLWSGYGKNTQLSLFWLPRPSWHPCNMFRRIWAGHLRRKARLHQQKIHPVPVHPARAPRKSPRKQKRIKRQRPPGSELNPNPPVL